MLIKCSDDKDLIHLFQEYVQVEQFSKQNDDLFFAKILIDWIQSDSICKMVIREFRIDDFLICYLQFQDFSYGTENDKFKNSFKKDRWSKVYHENSNESLPILVMKDSTIIYKL